MDLKKIDRLIIQEIVGPWLFGVAMFTVLILAGTYLFELTRYFVQGISFLTVMQMTGLLIPGVLAKTFAMALLLAGLLSFGRLSSDSEIVALRAAGVSIGRMVAPVGFFSLFVATGAFIMNETLVPWAAKKSEAIAREVAKTINVNSMQPLSQPQFLNGKLIAMISAKDFSFQSRTLRGAIITVFKDDGEPNFILYARELRFQDRDNWRMVGGGFLTTFDGSTVVELDGGAWPPQVPNISASPEDLLSQRVKNLDVYTLSEFKEQIAKARANPHIRPGQVANLEYGYWNKFSLPLAALVYGLLGAPLGIRNHRTGAASGFSISIGIIFAYITLANLMNVYAMGGRIPPYLASFTPLVIGTLAAAIIIWRKNV